MSVQRFRRAAASAYLHGKWGVHYAPSTLAKLACIGGGPKFEHFGRWPLYPKEELDAWALSKLSHLKSSTSDQSDREAIND